MREIYLVRHGESEHHVRGLTGGWTDLPLTDRGAAQARRTAARVAYLVGDRRPLVLLSSDLSRARMTAETIADALATEAVLDPGLREFNNGSAAGLTIEEAAKIELPRGDSDWEWIPYPGAENWRIMTVRVCQCLDLHLRNTPETAVIVSHGNAGQAVITWWLGLTGVKGIAFQLDPCSITHLAINGWGERMVVRLNDTAHLQAPGPQSIE